MPVDKARILTGFDKRLAAARLAIQNLPNETSDCDDDDISLFCLQQINAPDGAPERMEVEVARFSLKFKTLSDQFRFLDQFGTSQIASIAKLLTIGVGFAPPPQTLPALELAHIGDSDYSLIAQAISYGGVDYSSLWNEIQKRVRPFLKQFSIPRVHTTKTFVNFLSKFGLRTDKLKDLSALNTAIHHFRQSWWAVVGADALSGILALTDPAYDLTELQLERCFLITKHWNLGILFFKLALLRALGGYKAELQFVRRHKSYLKYLPSLLRQETWSALAETNSTHSGEYVASKLFPDPLNQLLAFFVNIRIATKQKRIFVVKEQIAALYACDPHAASFLDWGTIHTTFELPASDADAASILIKALMSSPSVAKRFLPVALARGRGQLVADLSSFVIRLRSGTDPIRDVDPSATTPPKSPRVYRSNFEFIRRVKMLPRIARHRVMEEVLDKGMMERIAFAFPTSFSLPTKDLPRIDNHASILRLELANLARREDAIEARLAEQIIAEETQFLRMHRFHEFFQAGRIKVDWDHLTLTISIWIEEQLEFLLSRRPQAELHATVRRNVLSIFAEEIADILLFNSESSLDQALSNNLRHGVVVPRFVRAFNEAVVASANSHSQFDKSNYEAAALFGRNGKYVRKLHNSIISTLNEFKDYWLTVGREGRFYTGTKEMIIDTLSDQATFQATTESWTLASVIVDKFRKSVASIFEDAHVALNEKVKPLVLGQIAEARVASNKTPSSRTSVFLDILENNIQQAFDEVLGWCGLLEIETNVRDFALDDLVSFEAMSLIFSDIRKLHVRCTSFQRQGENLKKLQQGHNINGAFFEPVQEIVHNLISNAFRHSGLAMNTEIEFSTISDGDALIFRCSNSYSDKSALSISDSYRDLVRMLKRPKSEGPPTDVLSGYQKIKNVCSRVFGREVTISIPPISQRSRRFIVEVALPNGAAEVLVL